MSVSGLTVTVVGWAASTPREIHGDGVPYTSFRLATTPRWFDGRVGRWVDGRTEWITVKAFRDVAFNVAASVRKGDPLVVTGRMRTEEWSTDGVARTGLVLDVAALGHDLTRGTSTFARRVHVTQGGSAPSTDEAAVERLGPDDVAPDAWSADEISVAPGQDAADAGDGDAAVTGSGDVPDLGAAARTGRLVGTP